MARIAKSEYPRIQQMASAEGRKVAEIAGLYGCTPANIYAILARLRGKGGDGAATQAAIAAPAAVVAPLDGPACPDRDRRMESAAPGDLFAPVERGAVPAMPFEAVAVPSAPQAGPDLQDLPAPVQPTGPEPLVLPEASPARGLGPEARLAAAGAPAQAGAATPGGAARPAISLRAAKASRPGFALCMRTAEGDESSTSFRSLDDLLTAAKPILRSAARSPDAIWFSIQPVDLAEMDSEAA